MYIQELQECEELQRSGARYYPDDNSDAYILVRRSGTLTHKAAIQKAHKEFPPIEFIPSSERNERNIEMTQHLIVNYFVADMVGFYDSLTKQEINYSKNVGGKIFCGEKDIGLVNGIIEFSSNFDNYKKTKCINAIENINDHIKLYCFGDLSGTQAEVEEAKKFILEQNPDEYNEIVNVIKPENQEALSAFFELCRERGENEYLKRSDIFAQVESSFYPHEYDDMVYIIKEVDSHYMKCRAEKAQKEADKVKNK